MRPTQHVIISAAVGVGLAYTFHSWPALAGCLIGGVLIDIDHHLDFYLARGAFPKYKELVDFCEGRLGDWKPRLIFHSFEAIFLLWLLAVYYQWNIIWGSVLIGATVHMICDQFANPMKPLSYLTLYRLKNNFDKQKIFSQRYFDGLNKK